MSSSYYDNETIFSAGAALIDEQKKLVYLVHKNTTQEWLFPKGHIEPGETIEESAQRELFEETGYQGNISKLLSVQIRQDIKDPSKNKVIFWFLATLLNSSQSQNTQMSDESFSGEWKSKEEAIGILKWDEDKMLVEKAFADI